MNMGARNRFDEIRQLFPFSSLIFIVNQRDKAGGQEATRLPLFSDRAQRGRNVDRSSSC